MVTRYPKRDNRWKRLVSSPPLWALDLPGLRRFQDLDGRIYWRTTKQLRSQRQHLAKAGKAKRRYQAIKKRRAKERREALAGILPARVPLILERDDPLGSAAYDHAVIGAMSGGWRTLLEIAKRIDWSQVRPVRTKRWRCPLARHPVGTVVRKRLVPRGAAERHQTEPRYRLTAEGMEVAARLAAGEKPLAKAVTRSVPIPVGGLRADYIILSALSGEAWRSVAQAIEPLGVPRAQARKHKLGSLFRNHLDRLIREGYVEHAISDDYKYRLRARNYYRLTELGAFLRAEMVAMT